MIIKPLSSRNHEQKHASPRRKHLSLQPTQPPPPGLPCWLMNLKLVWWTVISYLYVSTSMITLSTGFEPFKKNPITSTLFLDQNYSFKYLRVAIHEETTPMNAPMTIIAKSTKPTYMVRLLSKPSAGMPYLVIGSRTKNSKL